MAPETGGAVILLASGQTLRMRAVLLFEQQRLNEIALLRAEAAQKMGGVSSGIGFIGSPEWVLGASAVTSLIAGALSASARKQGIEMLNSASAKSLDLLNNGIYFPISELANHHLPYPALWSAQTVSKEIVQLWSLSRGAIADLLKQHNKTKADINGDQITLPVTRLHFHNGEEFVSMETDIGPMNIRWSNVIGYSFPRREIGQLDKPPSS
jgi:hypothetical protein